MRFKLGRLTLDWYLLGFAGLLLAIGIATIASVSLPRGETSLVTGQVTYSLLGVPILLAFSLWDYRRSRGFAIPFFLLCVVLLVGVLLVGQKVFGAQRWLAFGGFQLQPSELTKLAVVLLSARVLSAHYGNTLFRHVIVLLLMVAIPVILVLRQPDLGTATVIMATLGVILLSARLSRAQWFALIGLVVIAVPIILFNLEDYQVRRIETFLDPAQDPQGAGYNVRQSLIAIGNGGLLGQGLGHGSQSQLEFLPVAHTDFIFAGIAEAFGLLGSTAIVLLFVGLIARALIVARRARDTYGLLLGAGIAGLWIVQFGINLSMNLALAPVTGIPLPFVSHGGSSLLTNIMALGLLQSIARRSA